MLVYDDGHRTDEDNDLDFLEMEGAGAHFRGHGHGHKMPHVEMVAPAMTQEEEQQKEEKKGESFSSSVITASVEHAFCCQVIPVTCN